MFKKILFLISISCLFGQTLQPKYIAYIQATVSGAAQVVTIQQPATGGKIVTFTDAYIYCSVACNPTVELNGTGATATALAVVPGSNKLPASPTTAWSSSNAGSGTVVAQFAVAAGVPYPIDLTGLQLSGNSINNNLTIRTDAITGTVRIQVRWIEQ